MKTAQDIILKPVITERSVDDMATGKYTFKVAKDANKVEIAKAAEELFQVQVLKVNTVNPEPTADKDGKKRKGTIEFFDGMF